MKRIALLLVLLSLYGVSHAQQEQLHNHVGILAADEMAGRKAGSPQSRRCADYIAEQFDAIGLLPAAENNDGEKSFLQNFEKYSQRYANVVGFIPGNDPELRDEYIVIGAHYDHIGSRTRGDETVIYNGADDNASGVAVLLETARRLKLREADLKRSVIFAAFDAEEVGLYGSQAMTDNMRMQNVKFMASIDMVGWLQKAGVLQIKGTSTLGSGDEIFQSVPHTGLTLKTYGKGQSMLYGSDHDSFARQGIPAILITTGNVSPYHKPKDTAEKIDYAGLDLIADYTTSMAFEMATRPEIVNKVRSGERKLQFGLGLSGGRSTLIYSNLESRSAFSWSAGAAFQYNFNEHLALRPEVLYRHDRFRCPPVNDDGELLVSDNYTRLTSSAITIPVSLILKSYSYKDMYGYIGIGGFYSHVFNWRPDEYADRMHNDLGGFSVTVGARVQNIDVAISGNRSLSKLSANPKTHSRSYWVSLYYWF